jgi:hypothetical protein
MDMPGAEERIRTITHSGRKIIFQDFSHMKPGEEFQRNIQRAQVLIRAGPRKSVLSLSDVGGSTFNSEVVRTFKDFTKGNEPYIRASAIVGVDGLIRVGLKGVALASGRTFGIFDTKQEAIDWLVGQ